jgi:hypothetical protein
VRAVRATLAASTGRRIQPEIEVPAPTSPWLQPQRPFDRFTRTVIPGAASLNQCHRGQQIHAWAAIPLSAGTRPANARRTCHHLVTCFRAAAVRSRRDLSHRQAGGNGDHRGPRRASGRLRPVVKRQAAGNAGPGEMTATGRRPASAIRPWRRRCSGRCRSPVWPFSCLHCCRRCRTGSLTAAARRAGSPCRAGAGGRTTTITAGLKEHRAQCKQEDDARASLGTGVFHDQSPWA